MYVYISGRYGDADGYAIIDERINRAREAAAACARAGIPFFCPHLNSAHFEVVTPEVPVEFWLKQDAIFMQRAAALLVVEHECEFSAGTKEDVARARGVLGIPVFFWPGEFAQLQQYWTRRG